MSQSQIVSFSSIDKPNGDKPFKGQQKVILRTNNDPISKTVLTRTPHISERFCHELSGLSIVSLAIMDKMYIIYIDTGTWFQYSLQQTSKPVLDLGKKFRKSV